MSSDVDTRLRLGRATVLASAMVGQTGSAIAVADELLAHPSLADQRSVQLDMVVAARLHAYCLAGRYDELEAIAAAVCEHLVADTGSDDLRGLAFFLWGRALFGRGLVDSARVRLREAAALLREHDLFDQLGLLLSVLARVEAQLGHPDTAEAILSEAHQRVNPAIEVHNPYLALAGAWVASVAGDPQRARARALESADLAAALGCAAIELEALHDAVRLGEPALHERLARVAGQVDCLPAADYAAHATALQAHDGPALERCADRFAGHGLMLHAAEASIEAAELHARAGRRAAELIALDRAHRWARQCEGARTPVLTRGQHAPAAAWLTVREREIAELATRGMSNAQIADRLVLSRRTVGNHLTHIYDKLQVANRAELAVRLGGSPGDSGRTNEPGSSRDAIRPAADKPLTTHP
jgi:DNA-binding NarL/FixJ family response regulator